MSSYDEVVAKALQMPEDEMCGKIASLVLDPRWPAVLAYAARAQREAQAIVLSPKAAENHGLLAHAAGALFEATNLIEFFRRWYPQSDGDQSV